MSTMDTIDEVDDYEQMLEALEEEDSEEISDWEQTSYDDSMSMSQSDRDSPIRQYNGLKGLADSPVPKKKKKKEKEHVVLEIENPDADKEAVSDPQGNVKVVAMRLNNSQVLDYIAEDGGQSAAGWDPKAKKKTGVKVKMNVNQHAKLATYSRRAKNSDPSKRRMSNTNLMYLTDVMQQHGTDVDALKSFHAKSIMVRFTHNMISKDRYSFRASSNSTADLARPNNDTLAAPLEKVLNIEEIENDKQTRQHNTHIFNLSTQNLQKFQILGKFVFADDYQNFHRVMALLPSKRSTRAAANVLNMMRHHNFFRNMPQELGIIVCKRMALFTFQKNQVVFRQHTTGDCFYIVLSGSCQVVINDGYRKTTFQLYIGDTFGEGAVIENEPREGTVRASDNDCELLAINKETYEIMREYLDREENMLQHFFNEKLCFPFFRQWSKKKLSKLLAHITTQTFKRNDVLLKQGRIPDEGFLYVLKRGKCIVLKSLKINSLDSTADLRKSLGFENQSLKQEKGYGLVKIRELGIGDLFGSFSSKLLEPPFSVVVEDECTVYRIPMRAVAKYVDIDTVTAMTKYVLALDIEESQIRVDAKNNASWERYKNTTVEEYTLKHAKKKNNERDMTLKKMPVSQEHNPIPQHIQERNTDRVVARLAIDYNIVPARVRDGHTDGLKKIQAPEDAFNVEEVVVTRKRTKRIPHVGKVSTRHANDKRALRFKAKKNSDQEFLFETLDWICKHGTLQPLNSEEYTVKGQDRHERSNLEHYQEAWDATINSPEFQLSKPEPIVRSKSVRLPTSAAASRRTSLKNTDETGHEILNSSASAYLLRRENNDTPKKETQRVTADHLQKKSTLPAMKRKTGMRGSKSNANLRARRSKKTISTRAIHDTPTERFKIVNPFLENKNAWRTKDRPQEQSVLSSPLTFKKPSSNLPKDLHSLLFN